uniref:Smr domain-containing protein n=1 Tax=Strigamia maritima TaxID=126957 RepID=T1JA97_STRMM
MALWYQIMDSTLQALLIISDDIERSKAAKNKGEILRLSELLSETRESGIELAFEEPEATPQRLYTDSSGLYHSNEALYTEEAILDRLARDNYSRNSAPTSPNRHYSSNVSVNEKSTLKRGKSAINEVLSPQSDCSIEADASDIIQSSLDRRIEPRKEKLDDEYIDSSASSASNRPFYYFPFVSSNVSPLNPVQSQSSTYATLTNQSRSPAKKMSPIERIIDIQRDTSRLLVLLRGLPGSGKSTLAAKLANHEGVICSSDNYFVQGFKYIYDPSKLSEAHEWNQRNTRKFMGDGVSPIIIDNTNIEAWEMKPYVNYAQKYGYKVEILEPETPWKFKPGELATRNVHGITKAKIQGMLDRYERNLTVNAILGDSQELPKRRNCSEREKEHAIRNERAASCDSPRISPGREDFPEWMAKTTNSSESISPASLPISSPKGTKTPVKVFVDTINLNDENSSKPSFKLMTHGHRAKTEVGFSKVQNISTKKGKMCGKFGPPGVKSPTMEARDFRFQPISPMREQLVRKNALESIKDDYPNEDEQFWLSEEKLDIVKSNKNGGSSQRSRNRTRHSKGDLKAMEEIAKSNVVVHHFSISGSHDCCEEGHSMEPYFKAKNEESANKRTKTKIAASFGLPFVQYSGKWCLSGDTESRYKVDFGMQVNERDVFLMSQFPVGYECLVPKSRSICGKDSSIDLRVKPLDKATSTDDIQSVRASDKSFNHLKELFPHVSLNSLKILFEKCKENVELVSNMLLDMNDQPEKQKDAAEGELSRSHVNAAIDEALNLIAHDAEDNFSSKDVKRVIDSLEFFEDVPKHDAKAKVFSNSWCNMRRDLVMDDENDDDDDLVFQLEPTFASQLQQLFGPPSHSGQTQLSGHNLDIKINLNLAWQIHKCWAKSVQKKLYDEDCEFVKRLEERENAKRRGSEKPKRSVSLDRKRSRSCDFSDARKHSYRMEKTDSVPNMSDIMDMEMALQMSKDDAVRYKYYKIQYFYIATDCNQSKYYESSLFYSVTKTEKANRMWNDVDLATKMKRKLLYERYPFLDKDSLDEVFSANDFSLPQTEEQIQFSFGGVLPQQRDKKEVHATKSDAQRSGLVRKVSTMQTPVRKSDTRQTPVAEEMKDFRAESILYHRLRRECFEKAKEAYNGGKRGAASFYAQQVVKFKINGHTYTQKIWEANRHASLKILLHRNLGRDRNTIDLHLLYVREALEMLEIFLKLKQEELMNGTERRMVIAIITGRGKHSIDQVPRLKRGVINYLSHKSITYHEKHAGLIEATDRLTLSILTFVFGLLFSEIGGSLESELDDDELDELELEDDVDDEDELLDSSESLELLLSLSESNNLKSIVFLLNSIHFLCSGNCHIMQNEKDICISLATASLSKSSQYNPLDFFWKADERIFACRCIGTSNDQFLDIFGIARFQHSGH